MTDYRELFADELAKYAPLKPWVEKKYGKGAEVIELTTEFWPSSWDYGYDGETYESPAKLDIVVRYLLDNELKRVDLDTEEAAGAVTELLDLLLAARVGPNVAAES